MRWGLVPSWVKDPSIGNRMINARAETLAEKLSFKRLLGSRRCLVPANGFYEWRREGKRKIPMHIVRKDRQPFTFAGLWDKRRELERGELYSFTIITTEANALLRPIHDRMPVIMDDLAAAQWLDPVFTTSKTLSVLLQPYPSEWIEAYEVSTLLGVTHPTALMAQAI
jgi:putative SOS response-associated peptidase YedK